MSPDLKRLGPAARRLVSVMLHSPFRGHSAASAFRGEMVGVDLGGSSVKVARVRRSASGARLLDFVEVPVPATVDSPQARRAAALDALKGLVRTHKLSGKPAVGLMYGLDVTLRRSTMPPLSRADLVSALELEAQKYVPFPAERIVLDYETVGPSAEEGMIDHLVAACDRRSLEELRGLLAEAGLKVRAITVPPLAFRSLMRHARLGAGEDVVAFLDVGHRTTNLCIFRNDQLRFSRELSLGSHAFTEALRSIIVPGQGTIKLTEEEAERLKQEHGIPTGDEEKSVTGGIQLSHVGVMMRPVLERLVREVWSSFDYCNEEYFGESVQRVFLTGRGARMKNLVAYLESMLRVPVAMLDPSSEMTVAPNALLPAEPCAVGFAPALALEDFRGISLLRGLEPPVPDALRRFRGVVTVPRVAVAATLALLVDGGMTYLHHQASQARLAGLQRAAAQAIKARPELESIESRMRREQAHLALRATLGGGGTDWALLLKDLSLRITHGVWLKELRPEEVRPDPSAPPGTLAERRLVLEAALAPGTSQPEAEVAATLRSLMQSPFLTDVRLVETSNSDSGVTRVVISCGLKAGA